MIDFCFSDFAKVVLAVLLAVLQPNVKAASAHTAMLNIGDQIDGMMLTTGAAEARPLWEFCASEVNKNVTTANCRVSNVSKLAIGHVFLGTDAAFKEAEWSELNWKLYLDDQYIDLDQFGTYDYPLPTMAPNPSPVREVFMKFTAWDVVLTDLKPGLHIIEGRVRADTEEYSWVANLAIEGPSHGNWDGKAQVVPSRCPQTGIWLSRFHGPCKLYG